MRVIFNMTSISFLPIICLGLTMFDPLLGTNVFLAIPQNRGSISSVKVYITTNTATNVSVEALYPGIERSVYVSPAEGYKFSLPSLLMQNGSNKESKGILVSSEEDISVNVVIRSECCGGEGYRALPAKRLSTEYLVCSMYNSSVSVVATQNDTLVNITKRFSGTVNFNGTNYFYGDVISVTLHRLQTLQLLAENSYLIGSAIKANKPIAVISGQYYVSLNPRRTSQLDQNQMMEYLPPVNEFSRHFIVPQIQNASYVRLVVFTAHHDANVTVSAQGFHRKLRVRRYSSSVVTVCADRPNIFTSDIPVMLVLYPHGIKSFMTYILGEGQYYNERAFFVPDNFASYIALVIKARDVDGVRIDGIKLHAIIDDVKAVVDRNHIYLTVSLKVDPGVHVISHVDKSVRFGCISYGSNANTSYGFPL